MCEAVAIQWLEKPVSFQSGREHSQEANGTHDQMTMITSRVRSQAPGELQKGTQPSSFGV